MFFIGSVSDSEGQEGGRQRQKVGDWKECGDDEERARERNIKSPMVYSRRTLPGLL